MDKFKIELNTLKEKNLYRQIPDITKKNEQYVLCGEKELLNLSSNNYLNLGGNKKLTEEFVNNCSSCSNFIFSSSSSRLLSGTTSAYNELENVLAELFNKEAALIFNTGYQCNLGVISALAGKGDVIFSDKLNHASIIDGILLSQADFHRYKHLDYENLEELLEKYRNKYKRALIISETAFSMDGDTADIRKLVELKKKYNAILMLDEAHAFCTIDDNYAGFSDGNPDVDIITATFSKALGSFGGFAVSNKTIINYLINNARSFIFSTAMPPVNVAWTKWLLTKKRDYIDAQKQKLSKLVIDTHKYLKISNINTTSETHIVPLILGENEKAVRVSEQLKNEGYFILPVRPPSVPPNTARLRLPLCADYSFEDIKKVIDLVKNELYAPELL